LGLFSAVEELPTGKTGGAMQKKTGVPWQRFVKYVRKETVSKCKRLNPRYESHNRPLKDF
jgi:hypothetical protein